METCFKMKFEMIIIFVLDRQYSACWWSVEYVQWVGRGLLGLFFFKAETFMALSMKEIN